MEGKVSIKQRKLAQGIRMKKLLAKTENLAASKKFNSSKDCPNPRIADHYHFLSHRRLQRAPLCIGVFIGHQSQIIIYCLPVIAIVNIIKIPSFTITSSLSLSHTRHNRAS